jgi:hemerythrin-like metal-binding protein
VRSDGTDQLKIMAWDDSLSIDKGVLDNHHKRIFDQVNLFFGRMMTGEGIKGAMEMLDTLGRTLQQHFADEEALMNAQNYPDLQRHRKEHQDGWATYQHMRREVERGAPDGGPKLLAFVAEWLKDHIGHQDRKLVDFLRTKKAS